MTIESRTQESIEGIRTKPKADVLGILYEFMAGPDQVVEVMFEENYRTIKSAFYSFWQATRRKQLPLMVRTTKGRLFLIKNDIPDKEAVTK